MIYVLPEDAPRRVSGPSRKAGEGGGGGRGREKRGRGERGDGWRTSMRSNVRFFFFFCVLESTILLLLLLRSGVHHSSSSSSAFWGPPFSFFCVLGSTIIILLLRSGVHHSSSSSAFWSTPFFFFFCVLGSTIILLLLRSGVHHYSSSSAFPVISLGSTSLLPFQGYQTYTRPHKKQRSSAERLFMRKGVGCVLLSYNLCDSLPGRTSDLIRSREAQHNDCLRGKESAVSCFHAI